MALLALAGIACTRAATPPPGAFILALNDLAFAGKMSECQEMAKKGLHLFGSDPYWRFRFQLYLVTDPRQADQAFLADAIPADAQGKRPEVLILWDRAAADPHHRKEWLDQARSVAERLADPRLLAGADYRLADYQLMIEKQPAQAALILEGLVARARTMNYPQMLAAALANLSLTRIRFDRLDEAISLCQEAELVLDKVPNQVPTIATLETNLGWSLLQLGNGSEAMQHFERSANLFHQLHSDKEVLALRNQAAVLVRQGAYAKAQEKLEQAAHLLREDAVEDQAVLWADRAEVYVMDQHPDSARQALNQARRLAGIKADMGSQEDAHIRYVEAMIAEQASDTKAAVEGYRKVIDAPRAAAVWASMKLDASLRRARLLNPLEASRQYEEAEALLESMRGHLNQDEAKLSFSDDSSAKLYDQYVDFLVSQGSGTKALQVADRSRARLLSDYERQAELQLPLLQGRLRPVNGLALFYWLGSEHAYVWMVDPNGVSKPVELRVRPAAIRKLAKQYYEALSTDQEATTAGLALRDILLGPAKSLAQDGRRVFMILDDTLGLINPEALPGFHSKWWIEEAIVSIAPSLGMLQSTRAASTATIPLLAIGDAIGTADFPRLPGFSRELDNIKRLFPNDQRDVISQDRATPASYRNASPIRYDMIHFTAHGRTETHNPLDSAVILSRDAESKAFKLYARDIVSVKVQARLVTISACKSAGSRTYRGEGVVGLAWAFLRAGAGQVVAGLWNVDDEASQELMVRLYEGMREQHKAPAVALRDAKLALMKGYPSPYIWAPFVIFAGYVEP